jgi:hypothetical protein
LLKTVEDQNRVINDLQKDRNAMLEKENKLITDGIQLRDPSQLLPGQPPGLGMGFNFGRTASTMKIAVLGEGGQVIDTRLGTKEWGGGLLSEIDPALHAEVQKRRAQGGFGYNEFDQMLAGSEAVQAFQATIEIDGDKVGNATMKNFNDG